MKIDQATRAEIAQLQFNGNTATIARPLDRKEYKRVNDVLVACRNGREDRAREAHEKALMQVRIYFPNVDGSFTSQKFRLPRKRHLTKVLDRHELFRCPKCLRVFPYDFGCDVGVEPEERLWCDACWSTKEKREK